MNFGKTAIAIIAVMAIALLGFFAFSGTTGFFALQQGQETVKIGVLVPLTGKTAAIGEDVRNAILLASDDIEKGNGKKKTQLVVEDSKCDAKEAVTAFSKLVEADGVSAVIGVVCSGDAEAIGPIANEKGIPTMLSVANAYEPKEEHGWVFKFWPSDNERAEFEARLLAEELGIRKIAIIFENDARSSSPARLFGEKAKEFGASIAAFEPIEPNSTDFRSSLLKVKNSSPEAVFIFAYEQATVGILRQSKELGIETRFFATSSIISQGFLDSAGDTAEGIILDLPIIRNSAAAVFEQRMFEKFNDSVMHPGTYFAYDSLAILAEITQRTTGRAGIKEELYKMKAEGISGAIEFDSFGKNKEKKEFGLLIIRGGKFVPYEQN